MDISVVIPVLNVADVLPDQIDALISQDFSKSYEIVIVDNGSDDGTTEIVRQYAEVNPAIRLVDASCRPKGGAAAKNLGVAHARSSLIAFADGDDVVAPGWLQVIHDALCTHDVVSCSREYNLLNQAQSDAARLEPDIRGRAIFMGIPVVSGGAFGIRRETYLALNGFNEDWIGAVDTEFGIRLFKSRRCAPHHTDKAIVHIRTLSNAGASFRRTRVLAASVSRLLELHHDILPVHPRPNEVMVKVWTWLALNIWMLARSNTRKRWLNVLATRLGRHDARRQGLRREPGPQRQLVRC